MGPDAGVPDDEPLPVTRGVAVYWTMRDGPRDILWGYPFPSPECPKIENLVSFFNEKVDIHRGRRAAAPAGHDLVLTVTTGRCQQGGHNWRTDSVHIQVASCSPRNVPVQRCSGRLPSMPTRIAALVAERADRASSDAAFVEGRTGDTITWGVLAALVAGWTRAPR